MQRNTYLLSMTMGALAGLAGCVGPVEDSLSEDPSIEEELELSVATQALTTTAFADTHYNANSWGVPGCGGFERHLVGQEPTTAGTYPVFLYFVGYMGNYQGEEAMAAVNAMAAKGFVAASVEYTNGFFDGLDCNGVARKASCAFDANAPDSAIAKMCGRAKADCSKGIVVLGHSVGGGLALLAHDYNPNVEAVITMGTSLGECYTPAERTLPQSRYLALAGEDDDLTNSTANLNTVTGLSCPTNYTECKLDPGAAMPTAGWYQVQNSDVADGSADHCYFAANGCNSSGLDVNWAPPARDKVWSLERTLEWLDSFVTH